MTRILVIRFGSLGDLCLLGWAAAERRDRTSPGAETVTLVTKPRFADLMRGVRGVDEVIAPQDLAAGDILRLAGILRGRNFDTILDAHNILRGHLLLAMMGRRPEKRLAKDTSARLWFMRTGRRSPALDRTMGDRFREVMLDPGETADPVPATMVPPLAAMVPPATMRRGILGLAPGEHVMSPYRETLRERGVLSSGELAERRDGETVRVAGWAVVRQRPPTANGMLFITLEDEEGLLNLIVRPGVYERYREALRNAPLLWVEGRLQREGQVTSVLVHRAAAL